MWRGTSLSTILHGALLLLLVGLPTLPVILLSQPPEEEMRQPEPPPPPESKAEPKPDTDPAPETPARGDELRPGKDDTGKPLQSAASHAIPDEKRLNRPGAEPIAVEVVVIPPGGQLPVRIRDAMREMPAPDGLRTPEAPQDGRNRTAAADRPAPPETRFPSAPAAGRRDEAPPETPPRAAAETRPERPRPPAVSVPALPQPPGATPDTPAEPTLAAPPDHRTETATTPAAASRIDRPDSGAPTPDRPTASRVLPPPQSPTRPPTTPQQPTPDASGSLLAGQKGDDAGGGSLVAPVLTPQNRSAAEGSSGTRQDAETGREGGSAGNPGTTGIAGPAGARLPPGGGETAKPAALRPIVESGLPGRLGEALAEIARVDRRLEEALRPLDAMSPEQKKRAAHIFRRVAQAAERGFPNAQYNAARMLLQGRGTPRDMAQALKWLERASERGYTPAQLLLGYLEAGGLGGQPDLGKASFWWTVAERRGNKAAGKAREIIHPLLTAGDIITARRLRAQWQQVMSTLAPPISDASEMEALNDKLRDAAETGDAAALLSALLQGADADSRDLGGRSAMINAAWRGRKEIIDIMLSNGADAEAEDDNGRTALMWGAINGHRQVVERLVDAGSNPNRPDSEGVTALMRAAWNGHAEVVEELLRNGADPNLRDRNGMTALDYARREKHTEIVRRLQAAK